MQLSYNKVSHTIIPKKESLCNSPLGLFRLATNSLTGNWKPGGERIPHPHQLLLRKAIKQ
jgi:hypothetical protein